MVPSVPAKRPPSLGLCTPPAAEAISEGSMFEEYVAAIYICVLNIGLQIYVCKSGMTYNNITWLVQRVK